MPATETSGKPPPWNAPKQPSLRYRSSRTINFLRFWERIAPAVGTNTRVRRVIDVANAVSGRRLCNRTATILVDNLLGRGKGMLDIQGSMESSRKASRVAKVNLAARPAIQTELLES